MDFKRNNLDKAASPYLQQHKDNPIFWQEWSEETLEQAGKENKILFVSVGYSTCHWCHVMAQESFSDKEIADYLNEYFVSIKVDREQRPDIDKYLMNYIMSLTGQGGWPLNAFLTPDLKPLYALTYASTTPRYGLPSFIDILRKVKEFAGSGSKITRFEPVFPTPEKTSETELIATLFNNFDNEFGGFGNGAKFPPHSSLLFMLHYFEETQNEKLKTMLELTLDKMISSGLSDHLQGGFFRYCVDREWRIPHFEKMLYDQAMLLWVYSSAFKVFKKNQYKIIVEKMFGCLKETFEKNSLFYSAHDADTNHEEGVTYLWTVKELKEILTGKEFGVFSKAYQISDEGNFEGKNHLIKTKNSFGHELSEIEKKLLKERKKREQPFTDKKIVTNWNSLIGIALVNAYRHLGEPQYFETAEKLFKNLVQKHYTDKKLSHSSLGTSKQEEEFLEDYATTLLFTTYLHEETGSYTEYLKDFYKELVSFKKKDSWIESSNKDFVEMNADSLDQPIPSSVSLAELALTRTQILRGKNYLEKTDFKRPLNHDFLNINSLIRNGLFHVFESPKKLDWKNLPLNSIQFEGKNPGECYKGTCKPI